MMQVPENEVMNQTDLSGSFLHKQTTDFTTVMSKVSMLLCECLSISARMLLYPKIIYVRSSFTRISILGGYSSVPHLLGM